MAQQNKKITELPLVEAADGLLTLGVNSQNESVQIPLGDLLGKINNTKKNKDFVMTMTYDKITTDEGAELNLVDTEWDALADIVSHGECDIVLSDGLRNAYQLDHVFLSDGMPFGYKILQDNRTLNIATVIDSASSTLKLVWKFNDNAVKYDELSEKPKINGVELSGNKTSQDLKLQGALSTSADLALRDDVLSLTEMAKKRLFIDLWNECAVDFGRYNEDTGYFELNGITDLTWDDALMIYEISANTMYPYYNTVDFSRNLCGQTGKFRTNLPSLRLGAYNNGNCIVSINTCSNIEVLNVFTRNPYGRFPYKTSNQVCVSTGNISLYYNDNLRKIMGCVQVTLPSDVLRGFNLPLLEEAFIKNVTRNYKYFYRAPRLNYASVKYMLENRGGTNAITIWYHADVYNKILGTAADSAYEGSGGTKEEWMALADLATSKNITLATE